MKTSLVNLVKSREKKAENFRGQQPQVRRPSLACCSIINVTGAEQCLLFKRRSKVAAMGAAPNVHTVIKSFLFSSEHIALSTSVVPHLQNTEYPITDREAFPAGLEMLFLPHIINSVYSSWIQMGSSAQRTVTPIRGLSMTSWEMSEVSYWAEETTGCHD